MSSQTVPVLLVLTGFTVHAWKQPEHLKLDTLLSEALETNPEILAARKGYEAARLRPAQQRALPDPVFSPGYTSNARPWPGSGLGVWQTSHVGAAISQAFPFPGKRGARGEIAQREADAEYQEYQLVKLRVMSRLRQAYHRLQYVYKASDILTRNRDLLANLRRSREAPYFIGRAAQQAEVGFMAARLAKLGQERRSLEAEINTLLRRPTDAVLARPVDMEPPALPASVEALLAQARQKAPLLERHRQMIERSRLAVGLARKEYYPDYALSAGYFSMGSMPGLYEVRLDISLPLHFRHKQAFRVREQTAILEQVRGNYDAAEQGLMLAIRNEFLRAETSSQVMRAYADTILPQANRALESYLAAYEAGGIEFMTVQASFMSTLEYELGYYAELLDLCLAVARLAELTGMEPALRKD